MPNNQNILNKLPYASNWTAGFDWQFDMLKKGHKIIPTDANHFPCHNGRKKIWSKELDKDIWSEIAANKIPFTIKSTQWEEQFYGRLSGCTKYLNLPEKENPNLIDLSGEIKPCVSPFGPIERWTELGRDWGSTSYIQDLHDLYPDPPFVIFLSNNEAKKILWTEVHKSKRFAAINARKRISEEAKRLIVEESYISRYTALFEGMREKLPNWADKIIFTGYSSCSRSIGRYRGWTKAKTDLARLSDIPYIWDGVSASYYLQYAQQTDYNGWAENIGAMKWVAVKDWYKKVNPDMYWEISTAAIPSFVTSMLDSGQTFPYERYSGFVKWGMWMTKPTVVRDFQWPFNIDNNNNSSWFEQVVNACDEVHYNPILAEFWRDGTLVLNTDREHPYQKNVAILPDDLSTPNQWYALTTSLEPSADEFPNNPSTEQSAATIFNVWALAQVLGEAPNRRWLIYAYAPLKAKYSIDITIPDLGDITVSVNRGGSYFIVNESDGFYTSLNSNSTGNRFKRIKRKFWVD